MRGVPLYFTTQVEISRPRWYWFDETAVSATRTVRISYNVLTRQYRAAIDGSLYRNFAKLEEVLALLRRPGRRDRVKARRYLYRRGSDGARRHTIA